VRTPATASSTFGTPVQERYKRQERRLHSLPGQSGLQAVRDRRCHYDNKAYTLGDIGYAFSIQSISKVFTLALAMEEPGPEKVFQQVGSEPTGRPFNSVEAVVDMPPTPATLSSMQGR